MMSELIQVHNYRDQEKEIPFLSRRDGTIIARQLIAGAVENHPRVPAGTAESPDFIPLQSSRWDWQGLALWFPAMNRGAIIESPSGTISENSFS